MSKITIDAHDISKLQGISMSTARTYLKAMRDSLQKKKHHKVSIQQFANYFDLPLEEVEKKLSEIYKN